MPRPSDVLHSAAWTVSSELTDGHHSGAEPTDITLRGRNDSEQHHPTKALTLERRLLYDADHDPTVEQERPFLLVEAERLLSLYGSRNEGFRRQASDLLSLCRATNAETIDLSQPPLEPHYEVPIALKIALGLFALNEGKIPAMWCLAWYMTTPETRLRTPALRCRDKFIALFEKAFLQQFGSGLKLLPNKTPLCVNYRPMNPRLSELTNLTIRHKDTVLPDVTRLTRPIQQISQLAETCMDSLDAYSRTLGPDASPERRLRALAVLPSELVSDAVSSDELLRDLLSWLSAIAAHGGTSLVSTAELVTRGLGTPTEKVSTKDARSLSAVLERIGFGFEPDPRFGGDALKPGTKIAVFALPDGSMAVPNASYLPTSLWLHLAALVGLSDGHFDATEEAIVRDRLARIPELDESTRRRLAAHLIWLQQSELSLRGLAKKIEILPDSSKGEVAKLAVAVAGANGRIEPAEVKMLSRIYKLLGLDDSKVFEDIHELQATGGQDATSGPVPVQSTLRDFRVHTLPALSDGSKPSSGFALDMQKIRRKNAESQAISALLATIFEPESEQPAEVTTQESPSPHPATNAQASLLTSLASKHSWTRLDFDELVHQYGMMPNAALDAVNELAIEQCGDPLLIADGDTIEVDQEIMQEMLADV